MPSTTHSKLENNPYLQSKLLWNDLYGSVENKLRNANRLIVLLVVTLMISMVGLIFLANRNPIQPYVTVLHGNELLTVTQWDAPELETFKPKLATLLVREFIEKVRSTSLDREVNQRNFIRVLSMTSNSATARVKTHHQSQWNQNFLRSVHITSLIVQSAHAIHVRWDEVTRDLKTGEVMANEPYSAEITYQFAKTATGVIGQYNPLGFYITSVAWNKDIR